MFEEFLGLPFHPLLVHTAVVLVPLLVGAALTYALVPFVRRWITWAVLGLAVIAPLFAWFTTLSGNAFRNRLIARKLVSPEILTKIDRHRDFGDKTLWAAILLAVSIVLLVALVEWGRRRATPPSGNGPRIAAVVLTLSVLFFAGASAYYVFETGDSGARIVWDGF